MATQLIRFTIDGQSYDFAVDEVDLSQSEVRGDQWVMLDKSLKSDVIGIDVKLRVAAVWEQRAGPTIEAGELWRLSLSKAQSDIPTAVSPDTERALTIDFYADIQRPPSRWYGTRKGQAQRGQQLQFRSAKTFDVDDQQLKDIAAFQSALDRT